MTLLTEKGEEKVLELKRAIRAGELRCEQEVGIAPHSDGSTGWSTCRATHIAVLRDVRLMIDLSRLIVVCEAHVSYVPFKDGIRVTREVIWDSISDELDEEIATILKHGT